MKKNYYQILGVAMNATNAQLTAAYEAACARLQQSGLNDPATEALLRDAYEALSDPSTRTSYDESLGRAEDIPRLKPVKADDLVSLDENFATERAPRGKSMTIIAFLIGLGAMLLLGWFFMGKSAPVYVPPPAAIVQTGSEAPDITAPSTTPAPSPGEAPKATEPKARSADQIFADVSASVVKVIVADAFGAPVGTGSGVVTARGNVITNCHVVLQGPNVTVKAGKDSHMASVTLADETFDLCQLSVPSLTAPAVDIGSMQYVRTGQKVFAIGAPQGLELTISEGIVSSLREIRVGTVIQTTAAISPGSSGGGLFNVSGQLIGITTFQHRSGQNLNFAVPAEWIEKMEQRGGPGPTM